MNKGFFLIFIQGFIQSCNKPDLYCYCLTLFFLLYWFWSFLFHSDVLTKRHFLITFCCQKYFNPCSFWSFSCVFSLLRFISMKFKAVTFIDSSFLNCYFEDVSSVGSFFKNCTFVDSFFYNTGESTLFLFTLRFFPSTTRKSHYAVAALHIRLTQSPSDRSFWV